MKAIQKIILFLCSVTILASTILFFCSMISGTIFREDLTKVVVSGIDITSPIDEAMVSLQLDETTRNVVKKETEKIKEEIIHNKEFNAIVNKYSISLLSDISQEDVRYPDINKDIKEIISNHEADVQAMLRDYVDGKYVKKFMENIKDRIDLAPAYNTLVNSIKQEVTPQQKQVLALVETLTKDSTRNMSIALMAISLCIILIMVHHVYKWIPYVSLPVGISGVVLLVGSKVLPSTLHSNNTILNLFLKTECARMLDYGMFYLGIAVILLLLYIIAHIIFVKRNTLETSGS
ncbi:MAG: hypothetical protein RR481_03705 [Longicatena sp.]